MAELTRTQRKILDFIERSITNRGYPPTLRDICEKFSFSSTNGARYHIQRLKQLGFLEVKRYTSRGVRLIGASKKSASAQKLYPMPLLGQIPAGPFNFASPDMREDEIGVDAKYFGDRAKKPDLFGLRVTGDSMINAGILDGDVVVVRPQNDANEGDIVVARMDDEATVKRYYRKKDEIILQAENPAYPPIRIPDRGGIEFGQDVGILGVVVGLIRSM